MKKDLYNTNQANTLRLRTPIRLNIHCRGEPETINIYHKRYFLAIENPLIEVVVPVLNEERILKANIETLYHFLRTQPGFNFRITIADNGSTDKTQAIANDLANSHAAIRVVRLDKKRSRTRTKTSLDGKRGGYFILHGYRSINLIA